jgi:hypothetical protein
MKMLGCSAFGPYDVLLVPSFGHCSLKDEIKFREVADVDSVGRVEENAREVVRK